MECSHSGYYYFVHSILFTPIRILLLCVVILLAIIYSVTMAKRQSKTVGKYCPCKVYWKGKDL